MGDALMRSDDIHLQSIDKFHPMKENHLKLAPMLVNYWLISPVPIARHYIIFLQINVQYSNISASYKPELEQQSVR